SLELEKELSIYYEVLKKCPDDQGIIFWFQDKLITKYNEYYNNIKFENYDYVIFDHNLKKINFKYEQKVINIFVTKDIAIKRILKRDRGLEKDVDPDYFNLIYDTYDKNIDSVYPVRFSFDNNEDLNKQEVGGYDPKEYSKIYKEVNKYKKEAFLKFTNEEQEIFLKLFNEYNKNIEVVSKNHLPLEGTNSFYDKVRKECSKHVNEIRNLVNAREEYEEKLKFEKIENENKEIKEKFNKQKEENEKMQQQMQQQITEQAEMLKVIMGQMNNRPVEEIVKRIREENINSDNHISEKLNKKIKFDKIDNDIQKKIGISESEKIKDLIEEYFNFTTKPRGKEFERMTHNFLKCNRMNAYIREVPDGGVDIQGKFKVLKFVMQLKYHYDKDHKVDVNDVRAFCAVYSNSFNYSDYVGIFLTSSGYTEPAKIFGFSVLNKLGELSIEPREDNIKNLYNNEIYGYVLNDLEFFILKERYTISKIELKDFISEFNLKDFVTDKINNLTKEKNKKYHEDSINNSKRKYQYEYKIIENLNRKIIKSFNNQNPHVVINIKQEIEIEKRTTPFVFGFVGSSENGKINIINMFKKYLMEKGILEEHIYITKGFQNIIDNMNPKT
ncbi:2359_t:CDS:2, partial [Cetraspora pellucida]